MALPFQGAVLKRGDGAGSETFTTVGELVSVSAYDGQASEIDVTHSESTAREFLMGLEDNGTFQARLLFDPSNTQHAGLRSDRDGQTLRNFQFDYKDSTGAAVGTDSFSAFVLQVQVSGEVDGRFEGNVVLRISGDVSFA